MEKRLVLGFSLIFHIICIEGQFSMGGSWMGGGMDPSLSKLTNAYTALQAWKSAIKDDPLGILNTWVGSNVCSYQGIFCSDTGDEGTIVSAIDLNHANLQGTLVKQLSFLSDLSLIHLNTNRFTGPISDSFRQLTSLTELDLSNNLFSGSFPTSTLQIPNLIYLDLRYNSFSGPIPQQLFNKNMDAIFLNNNHFSGEIPQNLGNSPASVINLANNNFTGDMPFSFGYMGPRLKEILFLNNQLSGCIPQGIGLFSDLQVLDVSFNSLMGHLPDTLSCLNEIEVLNFGHNMLSGILPDLVCELRSLENLTVSDNFFSGFSQGCSNSNFGFDFSFNCIPGRAMQRPQPECSMIPGGGINCITIPTGNRVNCGALLGMQDSRTSAKALSP